jgi:uncharacterized membrane protein SpoIIM required for sporulation
MIIDLPRFIAQERPAWTELETMLDRIEREPDRRLNVDEVRRFHYLYEKVAADLAKITTFASEPETRRYLESLTGRAYGEIHETRERTRRFALGRWFFSKFPLAFRRHINAFWLAFAAMAVGALFGGVAVTIDPDAKETLLPGMFSYHQGRPSERVAKEEKAKRDRLGGKHATFAGSLMTNNIQASLYALSLGMTWGVGTLIFLFYNGVILGLIAIDYVRDGQTVFLLGWLLPHGVIELPAVMIAGQAGLVLGRALIGWGDRSPLKTRLRLVGNDLILLVLGLSGLLVWAGCVEGTFSQFHQPVVPYPLKIGFGVVELAALIWFLNSGSRIRSPDLETSATQTSLHASAKPKDHI